MPTYISLFLNKKFTSAIFQFDVLYKSLKMDAVRFALQCFVEWVLKKIYRIKENYILHFTHSDCVLFSTPECLICECSLFMGMPLMPYFWPDYINWCQLKLLSLATCYNQYRRKKQWNLVPSTFFCLSSLSHLLKGYHFSIKESQFPEVCHSEIWQSKNETSHFMFLQNATAIKPYYMQLVHST